VKNETRAVRFPKQARSRLTLHRLLSAAEALLDHGGLEAATVPAIAKAAGVSVGVVYRRFPDKDMLLRAVYQRAFENFAQQNISRLQLVNTMDVPLPMLVRGMVRGIAEGYRRKGGLFRALMQYARTHHDSEFRDLARQMNRATLYHVVTLLLKHRDEIRHPDPEMAIEFGLLAVSSVLHALILEKEPPPGIRPPERFEEELARMFLSYLGLPTE
jgi:AcrR family transcriptional regulator